MQNKHADKGTDIAKEKFDANMVPVSPGEQEEQKIMEWSLVLSAMDITHSVRKTPSGYTIFVPREQADRAMNQVELYEQENIVVPSQDSPKKIDYSLNLFPLLGLLLFYVLTIHKLPFVEIFPSEWNKLGSAHAEKILSGEIWRTVTALTLHADPAHVLGNVVIGALFIGSVLRFYGSGLTWLLVILTGISGNILTALVLGPPHNSIGFSTSVFGAAGLMTAQSMLIGNKTSIKAKLVPLAAGLGLLSMLGTGGLRTDLTAHILGLISGIVFGLIAGFIVNHKKTTSTYLSSVFYLLAVLLPAGGWIVAFTTQV